MSNIYAKPIKAGKSKYTISEQEQEAIDKAIESNGYNVIEQNKVRKQLLKMNLITVFLLNIQD